MKIDIEEHQAADSLKMNWRTVTGASFMIVFELKFWFCDYNNIGDLQLSHTQWTIVL